MIIRIIRIILIFQGIRRIYNTTKIELQEPVTRTLIVIRILLTLLKISLARCRQEFPNQPNLLLLPGRLKWLENYQKNLLSVGEEPVSKSKTLCKRSSQLLNRVFAKLSSPRQETKISQSRS